MRVLKIFLYFCLLAFPFYTFSQVFIHENAFSDNDLIKKLEGKGVSISNIKIDCPVIDGKPGYGYYEDPLGALGLSKGVILTSGAASYAAGPNDSGCETQMNGFNGVAEYDLETMLHSEKYLSDVCKVEFDIITQYDMLAFKYVFGSDEYPEYVTSGYHDVFGFFIHGPGIDRTQNIAVIPGTEDPIDVKTINDHTNNQYYIDNGIGSTPFLHIDLEYDGYTQLMEAKVKVVPCQTYHIKLAIADVKDSTCDSGIFLEHGSFVSEKLQEIKATYQHPQYDFGIENCNHATVTFTRENANGPKKFFYKLKGTALNGVDYKLLPESVYLPDGIKTTTIDFHFFQDSLIEGTETIELQILSDCEELTPTDTIFLTIKDELDFHMDSATYCEGGDAIQLNKILNADSYLFHWQENNHLSCLDCPSPFVSALTGNKTFYYNMEDKITLCHKKDSVRVTTLPRPVADFHFRTDPSYPPNEIVFVNTSFHADQYYWSFGDGSHSVDTEPFHPYPITKDEEKEFEVTLISKRTNFTCADTAIKKIKLSNVFFPNLITVNDDLRNDVFAIKGIELGFWNLNIYNRWGDLITTIEGYNNDWHGEGIGAGIYYYLLENKSKDRQYKGWLQLMR